MLLVQGDFKNTTSYLHKKINRNYFEFAFCYVSEDERFREIDRFLWESKKEMTVFKNKYVGPCVIDVSEWNDKAYNRYFEAFMYFVLDLSDSCDVYLTITEECSIQLKSNLQLFFHELKVVALKLNKERQQDNVRIPLGFHFSSSKREDNEYVRNKI